jgi:hypothetical protein
MRGRLAGREPVGELCGVSRAGADGEQREGGTGGERKSSGDGLGHFVPLCFLVVKKRYFFEKK